MNRRPSHAAGESWRKWGDPMMYRRPWAPDVFYWLACIAFGAIAAVRVLR